MGCQKGVHQTLKLIIAAKQERTATQLFPCKASTHTHHLPHWFFFYHTFPHWWSSWLVKIYPSNHLSEKKRHQERTLVFQISLKEINLLRLSLPFNKTIYRFSHIKIPIVRYEHCILINKAPCPSVFSESIDAHGLNNLILITSP